MRVAITGSTGLLGEHLVDSLRSDGHTVHRVVRDRARVTGGDIYWSVDDQEIDAAAFEGIDGVVHLAGEPLGTRWTPAVKQRILASRRDGTRLLAEALASLDDPPDVLVSASGVHYYGDSGSAILTEDSPPGEGFLPTVVQAWEAAADPARDAGIRVAHARTGVVVASEGPLIEKVELPFKLGLGGRIGSGEQYVPWIALEDEIRALRFLLEEGLEGPANLCAPEPVTNAELTEAIGDVMNRPTFFPVPIFGLRLLYGEMGVTLATDSLRAVPGRLLEAGFEFRVTDLRAALHTALTPEVN